MLSTSPGYAILASACFCCILSMVFYNLLNMSGNSHQEASACELLRSLKDVLLSFQSVRSIFLCDHVSSVFEGSPNHCSCLNEVLGQSCTYRAVCILWTSASSSEAMISTVRRIFGNSESITYSKQSAQDTIPHFIIKLSDHEHLHLINWFEQDDGSWWFDKLPDDVGVPAAVGNEFYIGKYEGWLTSATLRPAAVLDMPADWRRFRRRLLDSRHVTCDAARAHRFHLREGRDASAAAERWRHRAWRLLAAAAGALDHLHVPFWLSSGTCLGYFRQCDFVPYMGDVDIGVRIAELRDYTADESLPNVTEVIQAMAARRLRLVHRFGRPADSLELSFRSPDNIKLDIFFFYDDGDIMWNGGTQARTGRKFRYDFPAFELCWTLFRELRVRVPCDTETYLRANYGADWGTPQPHWDWKSSPPNVRDNGVWSDDERAEVVQLLEH